MSRGMPSVMVVWVLVGSVLGFPGARGAGAQQPWDRQAVYAAREAQLKAAIESRPADPQPLVELAAFYLKPVAPRDVEAADGVRRRVMVPLRNEWIVEGIKEIYAVPCVSGLSSRSGSRFSIILIVALGPRRMSKSRSSLATASACCATSGTGIEGGEGALGGGASVGGGFSGAGDPGDGAPTTNARMTRTHRA